MIGFDFMAVLAVLVLAAGVFCSCRGGGICASDTMRIMMVGSGLFLLYAIADYFLLMY